MIRKKRGSARSEEAVAPADAKIHVTIDYPLEGEIITSDRYTIRLGAGPTDRVEVSVDGKVWHRARESIGYWWFDWAGYGSGPHTLVARISAGRRSIKSKPRSFTVLI